MNAPQIIYICLLAINVGIALAKHGQPKNENHSFFVTVVCTAISAGLLYWCGFFSGGAA